MTKLEAARELQELYRNEPWFTAVGIGMMCIYLYYHTKPEGVELPRRHQGYSVVPRISSPRPASRR